MEKLGLTYRRPTATVARPNLIKIRETDSRSCGTSAGRVFKCWLRSKLAKPIIVIYWQTNRLSAVIIGQNMFLSVTMYTWKTVL